MDNDVVKQSPQSPEPSMKKFLIPLLIVLVLIAVALLVFVWQKRDNPPSAVSTTAVEEQLEVVPVQRGTEEGVFSVNTSDQVASVGVPMKVLVKADSSGRAVVGFDAILKYDVEAFTLGEVKSSLTGFTAIASSRKNFLEVTSFKDLVSSVAPVFNNTEVLEVTLTPLKAGIFTVDLIDEVGSSNTKYIDGNTEVFIPQVNSVTVTVK